MPNLDPGGGAGRAALIDSLERLRKQYAGAQERRVAPGWVEGPPLMPEPAGAPLGLPNLGAFQAAVAPVAQPGTGRSTGPYDLAGDGGAWGPNGVNLYNPYLARGDMAAPGPGWRMDDYGTPFWRRDYIYTPNGPRIKGEDGYSGDYPLMTEEQLRQFGITF